jgi:hypothetical protein
MKAIFETPLIDLPPARPTRPDPICDARDLWLGLDRAEQYLGFSLQDIAQIFRHDRWAAVYGFALLGSHLRATRSAPTDVVNAVLDNLRGLLREAKERFGSAH